MSFKRSNEFLYSQINKAMDSTEIQNSIESAGLNKKFIRARLREDEGQLWEAAQSEVDLYESIEKKLEDVKTETYRNMPSRPLRTLGRILIIVGTIALVMAITLRVLGLIVFDWAAVFRWLINGWNLVIVGLGIIILVVISIAYYRRRQRTWNELLSQREERAGIRALEGELKNANKAIEIALQEKGILPLLRDTINDELNPSYEMVLPSLSTRGLSEVFDPAYEIPTDASVELKHMLSNMPGGSIGIAGPRGAGKTTLISAFCAKGPQESKDQRILPVMISAPVYYEARDFILHLFSSICRRFLKLKNTRLEDAYEFEPQPVSKSSVRFLLPYSGLFLTAAAVLLFLGLLFGVSALMYSCKSTSVSQPAEVSEELKDSPTTQNAQAGADESTGLAPPPAAPATNPVSRLTRAFDLKPGSLLVWGFVFLTIWIVLRREQSRVRREREEESYKRGEGGGLVNEAKQWLRRIKFQQSYTSGWSGSLKLPVGLSGGVTEATALAERQFNLPEIVAGYRDFLTKASQEYRVIIGIDELDKIHSEETAHRFLNEIKSIFGLERCFYLVSVSEGAMSNFERRGLPFRDVFDSSFDDILYVDYLDLNKSKHLLRRRVIGLPIPFVALCYCFSGGLARDLIRTCRSLLEPAMIRPANCGIAKLTTDLISKDIRSKLHALEIAARDFGLGDKTATFFGELRQLERIHFTANNLQEAAISILTEIRKRSTKTDSTEENNGVTEKLKSLQTELASYLFHCSTILAFFSDALNEENLTAAENSGTLDQLARARQSLAVNPVLTWSVINDFRSANHMNSIPFEASELR